MDKRLDFTIKKKLTKPHPLVKQAKEFYNERTSWSHLNNGCTIARHDILTIKVALKNLSRALMQSLA
ncbi:hypothetical protein [Reichenbachiella faecimaris]|uniref:hypothetical protein n=1 Tax=Reichenbachiella faecimaris TaxID=692418 RepID=UPI000A063653|nr:hypothetical protein [Reichenbachiella faecimaris]